MRPRRQSTAQTIRVDIGDGAAVNTFVPTQTFGAGIDRMNSTAVEKLFTQPAIDTGAVRRLADRILPAEHRVACRGLALEPGRHLE